MSIFLIIFFQIPHRCNFLLNICPQLENQKCLKDAIQICEEVKDFVSREILENILEETEEHIDWIETQNHRIKAVTLENYLQEQMEENSS